MRASPSRILGLCLTLLFAVACGDAPLPNRPDGGPGKNPPVDSAPLVQLKGELRAPPEHEDPLPAARMALAWYPGMLAEEGGGLSQPKAIETQDVAYDGQLPRAYGFNVFKRPPESALATLPEGLQGRGAVGLVLAYADGNGNGKLDTIPAAGSPVDHVLASSLRWTDAPAYLVVYLDSAQAAGVALKKGFNLVRLPDGVNYEVVPFTTPIPLSLSGGPELDLLVCEAAWDGSSSQGPCGLQFGDPEDPVEGPLLVGGTVMLEEGTEAEVELTVTVGGVAVADADVVLAGSSIAYDAVSKRYRATLDPSVLTGMPSMLLQVSRGDASLERQLAVASTYQLDAPLAVKLGTPFTVRWSYASGADDFRLSLWSSTGDWLASVTDVNGQAHTFGGVNVETQGLLRAEAVARSEDVVPAGLITVHQVRHRLVRFQAAEVAQPRIEVKGLARAWRYGSETILKVFVDGEQTTDAFMWIGQTAVGGNPESGLYEDYEYHEGSRYDFGPVELRVVAHGHEIRRTLTMPGAVTILAPEQGTTSRSDTPLHVAWAESTHANAYVISVVSPTYPIVTTASFGRSVDLETQGITGLATLYVEAVNVQHDEGGTSGLIEVRRAKEFPLNFVQ
ncbi:MAG TPA: hypothetical protein VK447_21085 [Myxococcaceae bacterium]|nr:hypothetical protein [Myxococcaceae bacterium]